MGRGGLIVLAAGTARRESASGEFYLTEER
jgi:hypothetical protein